MEGAFFYGSVHLPPIYPPCTENQSPDFLSRIKLVSVVVPTIPFLRIQMRSGRAGARPLSICLLARDRQEGSTKRVSTVWKREAPRGERKIRSQAHGYMALLVNTMLRKHHGAVQRGHDVSILSSPREASLEGPQGTRCLCPSHRAPLLLVVPALCSRSPLRKSVQNASRKGYHTPGLTDHPAI